MTIRMGNGGFFNFEKTEFHGLLGRRVIVGAFALDKEAVLAEPFKQAVLADFDTVAFEDFRQFAD